MLLTACGGQDERIMGETGIGSATYSRGGNGALLLTDFASLDELRDVVDIRYDAGGHAVTMTHRCGDLEVTSTLSTGISEKDFVRARFGGFWDKVRVAVRSPYAVWHRKDLARVEILGRRRPNLFGEGDVAFYDLAEAMEARMLPSDTARMSARDLSDKGYLNTFNHVMAQAFITTLYAESVADFIADVHERDRMPELVHGRFTDAQVADVDNGPVDNYLDLINNEWGQELGKRLRAQFGIDRRTLWTPMLLADYLNAILAYHGWAFGIGFAPFRPSDEIVVKFSRKINGVNGDLARLEALYW
jgi:hypothetical protein